MPAKGAVLFNSSIIGSNAVSAITWDGGRTSLVVNATQYGTSVNVQLQGPSGAWIPISSSIIADQIFNFDAPPGQYRIVAAGSSIGLAAVFTSTPYM